MKKGLSRFTFYLQQVSELLNKARKQNDPAMWLFTNNARTPFFMLEGLAKIYAGIHNAKKFGKLKEHFKLIEDGLGQIDYYNWLSIAFEDKNQITAGCKHYVKDQLNQKAVQLNKVLSDNGWLSEDDKRLKKITKKLKGADWLNPVKEIEALGTFYRSSITAVTKFAAKTGYSFDNVEEDVHELRRKLRWLSIYPQAMQGAIQYAPDSEAAAHLKKYLIAEIVNSPYNKLPAVSNNTSFLLLQKNYFLALSWMIAQLGNLKDEGLFLTGLSESIEQSTDSGGGEALAKAYELLGIQQRRMQAILDDAGSITKVYFTEKNLEHLIAGIVRPR